MKVQYDITYLNKAGELQTEVVIREVKNYDDRIDTFYDLLEEYRTGSYEYLCSHEIIKE